MNISTPARSTAFSRIGGLFRRKSSATSSSAPSGGASAFSPSGDGQEPKEKLSLAVRSERAITRYADGPALEPYVTRVDNAIGFLIRPRSHRYTNEALEATNGPVRVGVWLFLLFFVFGFAWAALAPLNSAAVAPGKVIVNSNKKSVEHLQGGIVAEILVKEGDTVKKDDPLIRLDDTQARASWQIYTGQLLIARAEEARLMAERDNAESVTFPADIWDLGSKENVAKVVDAEKQLFAYRRKSVEGQVGVLEQRVLQYEQEIEALKSEETSADAQLKLIDEEIFAVRKLVASGQAVKPRLLELQRTEAELQGKRGDYQAQQARSGQNIAENKLAILNVRNDTLSKVLDDLKKIQTQIADVRERITATKDTLDRILIASPSEGRVTGLEVHTVGGVIQANAPLMYIVPNDEEKIIEARIQPQDIDLVHEGLPAMVRLSAYKSRRVPALKGEVTYISADRFEDRSMSPTPPYYKAYIKLDKKFLDTLEQKVEAKPGMAADVQIITGTKTPLRYLFDPITLYFDRAFKEQ